MVIHPTKSSIDKLCVNIRKENLNGLKTGDFNKLNKEEKNKIEESVYAMMAEYKHTPLDLDSTMPKELYNIVADKWHFCLQMEKEMRESTLATLLLDLTKGQIAKENKRHNSKFSPKNRAFSILQNKIEDVVNKSTKLWKSIYKSIDDVFDEEYKAEASAKRKEVKEITEKVEEKKSEEENKGEEGRVEEEANKKEEEGNTSKGEEKALDEQEDQSVQDTQMPPLIPPHATITPTEIIKIKDVVDTSCQNINP